MYKWNPHSASVYHGMEEGGNHFHLIISDCVSLKKIENSSLCVHRTPTLNVSNTMLHGNWKPTVC